jgi:rRNA maturation RNase YbeY
MIHFEFDEVKIADFEHSNVIRWIRQIAQDYQKQIGRINFVFCNDIKILEINKQFLNHDYYTDIITFDYSEGEKISGDIYISLDTVASNAAELNTNLEEEIDRVMIHGILHLCGQSDKTEQEKAIMTTKENLALKKRLHR